MRIIKNLIIFLVLITVIAGSFWISFLLGKNILTPVKKTPTSDIFGSSEADVLDQIGKITFEVEALTSEIGPASHETHEADDVKADYMKPKIVSKRAAIKQETNIEESVPENPSQYEIQNGLFSIKNNATTLVQTINDLGYSSKMEKTNKYYRVYTLVSSLQEAKKVAQHLQSKGLEAQIRRK